jgi:AcrR family transcriptional regulator
VSEAHARRLAHDERKALLVAAAEQTFGTRGYTQAGLADVASAAGVSKTLLYHYFPDGRPQLYREVMEHLVDHALAAVHEAAEGPAPGDQRLARVVGALVAHFGDHPDAYRLLVLEPWGSGDPGVVGQAMAARTRLASELNQLLAPAGATLPVTMAGGAAALGALLHICELAIGGQVSREEAVQAAQRFVRGGLSALDLL